MNMQSLTTPAQLERNSFLWSEARLALAAVALFLGATPLAVYLFGSVSIVWWLLRIAWIVSGVASGYLAYRWSKAGWSVFGGKQQKDIVAFAVSVLSGLNLGWTGLSGNNIGMSIAYGTLVFILTGVVYLVAAYHLWRRWNGHGQKVF